MNTPYDLVGATLPQALRLARYQASKRLPENINDLPGESDTINQTPSREEERLLTSNANIMTALENMFSWRQKDRTCRTSKLSCIESIRFQRAMYRIWLMSVLFGPRRFVPRRNWSDDGYDDRESNLEKSWEDQKTFLRQFSMHEIIQIDKLSLFLSIAAHWAITAEGDGLGGTRDVYDWDGLFLFGGPHIILRCYEDATTKHLPMEYLDDDGPYTKFLTRALKEIMEEQKVTRKIGYVGVILDDIHGINDRCHHCGGAGHFGFFGSENGQVLPDLYNETNWDDLRGQLDREFIIARNLCYNLVEKPILQALRGDWSRLWHEMFACRQGEYATWSKKDWICHNCCNSFLSDTIWRWRLSQRKGAHESVGEDCKSGYNCDQQCFERGLAHAKEFNHLCVPIDGAPPRGY